MANPVFTSPVEAPYTRFELTSFVDGQGHTQSFATPDDPALDVTVLTTTFSKSWRYPMTQVAIVSREEARSIWKRSTAKGLKQDKPYRQARFGPIPAKAA